MRPTTADLPVVFLLAGTVVSSWIVDVSIGYLIAFAVLLAACWIGLTRFDVSTSRDPILALFVGYWLLLVVQFPFVREPSLVPYLVLVPLTLFGVVLMGPRFVDGDRERYARSMVVATVGLAAIGVLLLALGSAFGLAFPWTGRLVMSRYPVRLSSVYANSNNFGFVMMVGALISCYLAVHTRKLIWLLATGGLGVALLLSDAKSSIVGFGVGAVLLLFLIRPRLGVVSGVVGAIGFVWFATTDLAAAVFVATMDHGMNTRLEYWETAIAVSRGNPLLGEGFTGAIGTHNSYVMILLNAGYPAGILYIVAVLGSLAAAIRTAFSGDAWDAHVAALLCAICLRMLMESHSLGGLSVDSWIFALYVGFAIDAPTAADRPPPTDEDRGSSPWLDRVESADG